MTNIIRIISVLSRTYEKHIIEFISPRGMYKGKGKYIKKYRAFKILAYFVYETWLNHETNLSLKEIAKLIHQTEESIISNHKYVSDRIAYESLIAIEVKTIKNILNLWKESQRSLPLS